MRLFLSCIFFSLPALIANASTEPIQQSPPLLVNDIKTSTLHTPVPLATQEVEEDPPAIPTIDLTTPPDDLWQRVRNGFAMPDLDGPLVANQQAWYLNHPQYLQRVFERAQRYLYYITSELEKRGMPTELALLPIIESAYNPQARSPARALGIWQFIPSTGKNYNLKQNIWFDERRDIVASTNAALDYMQYIYEMHGDWQLALASYNWGEGAVARAIAKNRAKGLPADYAHLNMPSETRNYVPKLQAIKNIVANPQLFGIALEPIPNQPYFSVVERNGDMDVALAARLAGIPMTEFFALNPAYNRPVMPDSANSPLVLPADKVQTYLDNLQDHEAQDKPLSAWRTYTLGKNEKLESVARRHGLSVAGLKRLNGLSRRNKIYPGLTLLVPGKGAIISDSLAAQMPQAEANSQRRTVGKTKTKAKSSGAKRSHVINKKKTAGKRKRR
jgi:membrane-bound lytic murein transglycosylase D